MTRFAIGPNGDLAEQFFQLITVVCTGIDPHLVLLRCAVGHPLTGWLENGLVSANESISQRLLY